MFLMEYRMHRTLLTAIAISLFTLTVGPVSADTLAIPQAADDSVITESSLVPEDAAVPETSVVPEDAVIPETSVTPEDSVAPEDNATPKAKKETFSVTLPGRGMTMEQVEERFGAPLKKNPAVGKPPITTWDYEKFTVYFEDRYVIHAVFETPK